MTGGAMWLAIVVTAAGCYLEKLGGLLAPRAILDRPAVRRGVEALPVALLAALVAVQSLTSGHRLVLDPRAAALAVAVGLVLLRAPFLVVVGAAAITAAVLRAV